MTSSDSFSPNNEIPERICLISSPFFQKCNAHMAGGIIMTMLLIVFPIVTKKSNKGWKQTVLKITDIVTYKIQRYRALQRNSLHTNLTSTFEFPRIHPCRATLVPYYAFQGKRASRQRQILNFSDHPRSE